MPATAISRPAAAKKEHAAATPTGSGWACTAEPGGSDEASSRAAIASISAVHELDEDPRGREIERALAGIAGRRGGPAPVPAVFIGGAYVGPMEAVMSLHLGGRLVPMLRSAGAIWL
ncbi:hypothetical protein C2845_PM02G26240 [Panicum miliaceum]|uniref:Uncharacterized protein n=1 Tax=Panicum miliaceum TaxID=4540 RepID=A0A3L6S5W7_PANMI|nr:hypothetical protein C2845_PM02G26240 [Panicum miliaceum]